jgi:mannose-1-phosphate guanylyltransferase/phosphomannomutase
MTVATHTEPFQIPFGEVVVKNDRVDEYLEKSTRPISISSGTYVLGHEALCRIPPDRRVSIPELYHTLREAGSVVHSFGHRAPWIDINDGEAVSRAALLIQQNREQFDQLIDQQDSQVISSGRP